MNSPASTTNSPLAIELDQVKCSYGDRTVLENISFAVKRAEIFFIIGGSGCGKSTLLRHMIGLKHPMKGSVKYFGRDFTRATAGERQELLRTFGVLYQSGALWSSMTLGENVGLPLELLTELDRSERGQIVALKLAQVGLAGYEDYYPSEISGGMRKRAGLARALALDPGIVFFDEPGAGLDPITSLKLDELVQEIRDTLGTTIVIVSHELASIFDIADRVVMLDREVKGIIAEGDPKELRDHSKDIRVREFLNRREETVHRQSAQDTK